MALTLQPQLETLPAWGVYLVVWGFIFVESALLVGFLLPGDSV
ncbi:MAG: DedA family protein, partial [Actinobacteria bacterium]|nr:DedA family protein [Actinomycetota bacterium]